jgi:P-type Ca2+ transporter type 2C
MVQEAEEEQTPRDKRLDRLLRGLLAIVVIVAAANRSGIGILSGRDPFLMIETGVALVVAAVPRGCRSWPALRWPADPALRS